MKLFFTFLLLLALIPCEAQSPQVVVQLGHSSPVLSIDKHPVKPWIATGGADNQLKIWDYNLRKLIITLRGHTDGVNQVKFMPGSDKYVLTASAEDHSTILWDMETGEKVRVYKHFSSFWATGLGFTGLDAEGAGGKYFYAGHQFGIEKWETSTGNLVMQLDMDSLIHDGQHHWVHHFTYAPDLDRSFFSDGAVIYSFDHKAGKLSVLVTATGVVSDLQYNSARKVLGAASAEGFFVYNAVNGKKVFESDLGAANGYSRSLSFSDKGDLLFLNVSPTYTHVMNWVNRRDLMQFGRSSSEAAVFIQKDEYIILAGHRVPRMYNISTLEAREFHVIDNGVKCLALAKAGRYLLKAGNENNVRIFDIQTAEYVGSLEGHKGIAWYVAVSPSGKYYATSSSDQTIKIWDANTNACIQTLRCPVPIETLFSGDLTSVAFKKVAFTPDEKSVISFLQGNAVLGKQQPRLWKWDIASGKSIDEYELKSKKLAVNTYISISDFQIVPGKDEILINSMYVYQKIRMSKFKLLEKSLSSGTGHFQGCLFTPDGKHMLIENGSYYLWDMEKNAAVSKELKLPNINIWAMAFNPAGTLLAVGGGFDDNDVYIIDVNTGEIVKKLRGHEYWMSSLTWTPDGKTLISGAEDSRVIFWDMEQLKPRATLVNVANSEDYVFYNYKGYYKITRSGFRNVIFRQGTQLFPFEQFDIKFNRPDVLLQSLGSAESELIDLYHKAYEKRLKALGLNETNVRNSGFYLPLIKGPDLAYTTMQKELKVNLQAMDSVYALKSVNIWVNEVPLYGKSGIDISQDKAHVKSTECTIPLQPGRNKIEMSCMNEQGIESVRNVYEVTSSFKFPKPDLYVVSISVSGYLDKNYDLKYAVKDGKDIAREFSTGFTTEPKGKDKYFNSVHTLTLFDTAVYKGNLNRVRQMLSGARPNDYVVVFFSGHGLLDSRYDFYYATYNCDFAHPEREGISYSDIESVLDASPARNKLLMIDACHSGDVDKEGVTLTVDSTSKSDVKVYTTRGSQLLEGTHISLSSSFTMMKELFASSERGTGSVIISAAAGDSYALESDQWQNGVFTYAVLKGIQTGNADANGDMKITVTELKNYVMKEVSAQTNGRQKPTCRKENLEYDFRVK